MEENTTRNSVNIVFPPAEWERLKRIARESEDRSASAFIRYHIMPIVDQLEKELATSPAPVLE